MGEQDVRAIDRLGNELSKNLGPIREDIKKSLTFLEQIVNFFSKLQTTIEDGFSRIMENQSIIMIISKSSELTSFKKLLSEQANVLEKKKRNLQEDLMKLSRRYLKLDKDLSTNAENTIMRLDGHVINLNKQFFDENVGVAYSRIAAPINNTMEKYYYDQALGRSAVVEQLSYNSMESIERFIDSRKSFFNTVEEFVLSGVTKKPVSRNIPIYIVQKKDRSAIAYVPGKMKVSTSSVSYNSEEALSELSFKLKEKLPMYTGRIQTYRITGPQKEMMKKTIDSLFEKKYLTETKWVSFYNELIDCIEKVDIEIGE